MTTGPVLRVAADLRFSVTDGGRRATGTVAADGDTVTVTLDRPWTALRAVRSADIPGGGRGRSDLAPLADAVTAVGLRVVVAGPNGTLLTLGNGVASSFGRLATGSGRIALRPRAVLGVGRTAAGITAIGALGSVVIAILSARRRAGTDRR